MKKALFLDILAAVVIAAALTIGALAYFDVLVKEHASTLNTQKRERQNRSDPRINNNPRQLPG